MKFLSALALLLLTSFVAQAQNSQYLYVTEPQSIEGFTINSVTGALVSTGAPTPDINGPVATAANSPATFLFAANANATVSVFQIATSGALTEIPGSPFATVAGSGTLPGAIAVSADQNYLYVASSIDLDISTNTGEMDVFSIQSNGSLVPASSLPSPAPPLVGVIVSPTTPFLYVCSGSGIVQQYSVNPGGMLAQLVALGLPSDGANSCVSDGQLIFVSRNVESNATGWIDSVGINADGSLTYLTNYKGGLFVSENDLAVQGGFLFSSANTYSISISDGNITPTNLNWINGNPTPLVASPTAPFLFQGSQPQFTNLVYPFLVASDGSLTNSEPPRILAAAPIALTVAIGSTPASSNPAFVFEPRTLNFSPVAASQNAVAQLSIYSTGSLPLEISGVSVTGSAFSEQSSTCGSTLVPGAICYIYISFAPAAAGSFAGEVSLTGNVNGVFPLTGTGVSISTTTVGPGTVGQSPTGNAFASGTSVALTAVPNSGATFTGWTGGCSGSSPVCNLTLTSNTSIQATFAATVTPPPATPKISITPQNQSGSAGQSFTYAIAETGFATAPQLTATCAIPKATCTLSGMVLTVATSAPTTGYLHPMSLLWFLAVCILSAAYLRPKRRPRLRLRVRRTALVVGMLGALAACGGTGPTAKVTQPTAVPGTPNGSYSIIVGANGSAATASAVLTVNP
jgi:Divergent InlB B-repeat domain